MKGFSNDFNSDDLYDVVTQGVVVHSPKPGVHDKSARPKNTTVQIECENIL